MHVTLAPVGNHGHVSLTESLGVAHGYGCALVRELAQREHDTLVAWHSSALALMA